MVSMDYGRCPLQASSRDDPINHYVRIDVSLDASSVCVVDGTATSPKILREPEALIALLRWS